MNNYMEIILLAFLVSLFCSAVIARLGRKISFVDIPNERSSHAEPTPRGGGIGIWMGFIITGVFIVHDALFTLIVSAMGLLGLIEDRWTISSRVRLLIQIIISGAVIVFIKGIPLSPSAAVMFFLWVIFISGTANFYNFMDGINGIAGLTGVIGFALLAFFAYYFVKEPYIALLSIALSAGCLGFLPFNFPKAKVFMGDVGSIFLGFVYAVFVVKLSVNVNAFLCADMFLCTFYADALMTFLCRWRNGEEIMHAHRSHLYQYMSNELAIPHWATSLIYSLVQLNVGLLSLAAYKNGLFWQIVLLCVFVTLFLTIYKWVKKLEPKMRWC